MISQFESYLTFENIYLWTNFGVIPFWLMLIFIPNYRTTQVLTNSVILPLILACAYSYTIYQVILLEEPMLDIFRLYLSLDSLYTIFSIESFLLVFWLHFVSLNLFIGSWLSRDAIKYSMPRSLVFTPLILVYFSGPIGLVVYWIVRVVYARKLKFHD